MKLNFSDKLTAVVNSFTAGWKKSIDAINGEIVKSFTDFKNGTNILQVFLLIYYNCYLGNIHTTCSICATFFKNHSP